MNKSVEAVILDWAGTVVDFGSFCPHTNFVDAFAQAFNFKNKFIRSTRADGDGENPIIFVLYLTSP